MMRIDCTRALQTNEIVDTALVAKRAIGSLWGYLRMAILVGKIMNGASGFLTFNIF